MKPQPTILLVGVKSYQAATIDLIKQSYPDLQPLAVSGSFEEIVSAVPQTAQVVAAINRGDEQIETHSRLVDYYGLPGPSFSATQHFRSKAALDKLMNDYGLAQYRPATITTSLENLAQKLAEVEFPVIIKPFQGAKSRGVHKLTQANDYTPEIHQELNKHFVTEPSLKGKQEKIMLIENFIEGRQTTVTAYLDPNGHIHNLGVVDVYDGYDVGQNHRQLVYRTTSSKLEPQRQSELISILQKLAQATGLKSTFIHPDFIVNQNQLKLIELNARLGGLRNEMAHYAYGLNLDLFALQLALGETPNDTKLKNHSCTGSDIWSMDSGQVESIEFYDHPRVVEKTIYFQPHDQYSAPPAGNQQLVRFYVETADENSLEIAQKVQKQTKIVIK